ncbi:hypothetical protein FRC03_004320 [Tulasnella sp. 419]|nr:hypothetical protein FRC03_004320 [Tulasnella sp. 419]
MSTPNYEIEIEFKISGTGGHLFGDGMAFWLTTTRTEFGPVFGSKDNFEGIGVFIDTYSNTRHSYSFPRIMAMVNDGTKSYDLGNDGAQQEAGACSASLRKVDMRTKIRMTYIRGKRFTVELQYKQWDEWTPCFEIQNITLPSTPYLGISAITGDVHDAHDIISISSNSLTTKLTSTHEDPTTKRKKGLGGSGEGSWTWTLFKLVAFGGICTGGFRAWKVYNARGNKWSNKRF